MLIIQKLDKIKHKEMKKKVTSGLLLFFFPKINSPKGRIDLRDTIQGVLRGALTSAIAVVFQSLDAGHLVLDWKAIAIAGITGALGYFGFAGFNGKKV